MTEEKKHYYLVAGELVFVTQPPALTDEEIAAGKEPAEPQLNSIRMNTVVVNSEQTFAVQQIALSQQGLQEQFHKKMADSPMPVQVVDVIIIGLMYCGHMTKEQFNLPPQGMQMVKAAAEEIMGKA